ncbi:MAG: dTDP-4-dehydrorhamnose reductase [Bryobacteraceae bacterium]|nr:dTDP-4-dehydrorhamnose reductase [Bryobacteraceae bacterium]
MSGKAILFGGAGQLGYEIQREFSARGYTVFSYDRSGVDITDAAAVEHVIASTGAGLVVNAAAYNMVDVAENEPQAAYSVNALAVRNMAVACRQAGAKLVHFSTDYVFDGTKGSPYTEDDRPHPLGAYAVSKLCGELYARAYLDDLLVLRTSGVFGPAGMRTARGNFVELMLRLAASGQPIRVVEDMVASPTYAPALAHATAELVERGAQGIFHAGGGSPISWFDYARLIFTCAGLEPELKPTSEREYRTPARRPVYSALSNSKLEALGLEPMPPVEKAIRSYLLVRAAMVEES